MDEKAAYQMAALFIERHGVNAQEHALQRAEQSCAAGRLADETEWMAVFDAILELKTARPRNGGMVH